MIYSDFSRRCLILGALLSWPTDCACATTGVSLLVCFTGLENVDYDDKPTGQSH